MTQTPEQGSSNLATIQLVLPKPYKSYAIKSQSFHSLLETSSTSTPRMSKHPESISLRSLSLTPSSKWSLDTDELEQATKSHAPKPPPRAWLHSIRRKAPTRHSYLIGDPILLPDSSKGYTFEG